MKPRDPAAPASAPPDAGTGTRGEDGFWQRWSERKAQAAPPAAAAEPPPVPESATPDAAPAPQPGDADMPPLESLDAHSDLSPFFSPKVSETLRRAALRQLFRQARFNVHDGLDDYCGDYRHHIPLGDRITADMRHQLERLQRRLEASQQAESAPADSPSAATPTPPDAAPSPPPDPNDEPPH